MTENTSQDFRTLENQIIVWSREENLFIIFDQINYQHFASQPLRDEMIRACKLRDNSR